MTKEQRLARIDQALNSMNVNMRAMQKLGARKIAMDRQIEMYTLAGKIKDSGLNVIHDAFADRWTVAED